jgi:hypothetical protein
LFIKKIKTEIIIPFYTQRLAPLRHENMTINLYGNNIFIYLYVGTPPQKISFTLKFLEYTNFILSSENLLKHVEFNESCSSSLKMINDSRFFFYADFFPFEEGILINETISLQKKSKKIHDVKLIMVTEIHKNTIYEIRNGGVIGLNLFNKNWDDYNDFNFFKNLYNKDLIKSESFMLIFDENDETGKFIIDPDDYNKYQYNSNEFVYSRAYINNEKLNWNLFANNIYYGNISINKNIICTISGDFTSIISTDEFKNVIEENFFNEQTKNGKCKYFLYYDSFKMYYCNKDLDTSSIQPLKIEIKEMEYTFELKENELWTYVGDYKYFLIMFRGYYFSENEWTISKPFLKKYPLIFDKEKKIIGFIKNKNIKSSLNFFDIKTFFMLILFILVISLLWFISYNYHKLIKPKKKRVVELSEEAEYDYSPFGLIQVSK